jgi:hypothetical protein
MNLLFFNSKMKSEINVPSQVRTENIIKIKKIYIIKSQYKLNKGLIFFLL